MTRVNTENPLSAEVIAKPSLQVISSRPSSAPSRASAVGKIERGYRGHGRSHIRGRTSQVRVKLPNLSPLTALSCVSRGPLFRGLSFEQHHEIASAARQCDFARRETIFREDDPVRSVFVIASGWVKTTQLSHAGKEVILRLEGSGEVIDGLGLVPGKTHSLTARTIEPCRVFSWEVQAFDAFAARFAGLRCNMLEILSERLRMLQERFRDMATERVPQRLARLLVHLFTQGAEPADGGRIYLSCEELAQMTGTTLFTVSRLLCDWAEQGMIQPERKAVIVESLPALLEVANGANGAAESSPH